MGAAATGRGGAWSGARASTRPRGPALPRAESGFGGTAALPGPAACAARALRGCTVSLRPSAFVRGSARQAQNRTPGGPAPPNGETRSGTDCLLGIGSVVERTIGPFLPGLPGRPLLCVGARARHKAGRQVAPRCRTGNVRSVSEAFRRSRSATERSALGPGVRGARARSGPAPPWSSAPCRCTPAARGARARNGLGTRAGLSRKRVPHGRDAGLRRILLASRPGVREDRPTPVRHESP